MYVFIIIVFYGVYGQISEIKNYYYYYYHNAQLMFRKFWKMKTVILSNK